MVKSLLRQLHRWPALEEFLHCIVGLLRTWPADDEEGRFAVASPLLPHVEPLRTPPPLSIAPATFERRFMKLHAEGRFEEMWDMLAEDSQRAWGNREAFIRDMPRLDKETELLDMQVVSVSVIEGWTDQLHQRTYSNVARMVMRYRVRQQWREWTFDRQVHLIPAAGGWRTLCYPA